MGREGGVVYFLEFVKEVIQLRDERGRRGGREGGGGGIKEGGE